MTEPQWGVVLAATLVVAAFARDEDRVALWSASIIVSVDWVLYNAPWHGWGLRPLTIAIDAFCREHLAFTPGTLPNSAAWAVQDTIASVLVIGLLRIRKSLWIIVIWSILVGQVGCSATYAFIGDAIWKPYQDALDYSFGSLLVVIAIVGGRGLGDRAVCLIRRIRDHYHHRSRPPCPRP